MKPDSPHALRITPHPGRVVVAFAGRTVVDTVRALDLAEGAMRPVLYVPRQDADMAAFVPTERHTHCPFKGEASYFSMELGDGPLQDAAWTLATPYDEHADLKDRVAFYSEKFDGLQFRRD